MTRINKANFVLGVLCGALVTAGAVTLLNKNKIQEKTTDNNSHLSDEDLQQCKNLLSRCVSQSDSSPVSISSSSLARASDNDRPARAIENDHLHADLICDELCINDLVTKFFDGASLSGDDWDNLRDKGDAIAASLSADPDALLAFKERISASADVAEIDGLLSIASALPDNQALELIHEMANYSSTHKALALQTLAGLSLYSENAGRAIENLVIGEQDPKVISAALNALETTSNYDFSPQTWQSLSSQFSYVQDPQLKGSILLSLAKHGKGEPATLKAQVQNGLKSQSSDLQLASIEALGYLLSNQQNRVLFDASIQSGALKSQLNSIVNDANAEASLRMEALSLLDQEF